MEHSVELILDLRPSQGLADETVKALGTLVKEASDLRRYQEKRQSVSIFLEFSP